MLVICILLDDADVLARALATYDEAVTWKIVGENLGRG